MKNDLISDMAVITTNTLLEETGKAMEEIDQYFKSQRRDCLCSMAIENQLQTVAMYALETLIKCYRPNSRHDQGALLNLLNIIIEHSPFIEVRRAAMLESMPYRLRLAGA
jgi:hypothetical protein